MRRQKTLGSAALLIIAACVGRTWAQESAWRPAAAARQQGVTLAAPRAASAAAPHVRLGAPTARKEAAADLGIMPTLFSAPAVAPKPMPLTADGVAKNGKSEDGKLEPQPELVPAPKTMVTPPSSGGYFFAAPGSSDGPSAMPPAGVVIAPPANGRSVGAAPCPTCGGGLQTDAGLCCPEGACCGEGLPCGCMFEGPHGPMSKVYVNFEFLLWTLKNDHVPALVTRGTGGSDGSVGLDGTSVLLGGSLNEGAFLGGRVQAGFWFDATERVGMIGSFFMLQERTKTWRFSSDGVPVLARPFKNALTGEEDSELVAGVDAATEQRIVSGSVGVEKRTQLLGADLNFRWHVLHAQHDREGDIQTYSIDFLAGFRYQRLAESLTISERLLDGPAGSDEPEGTRESITDRFRTSNDFYGGQVGLMAEKRHNNWFLNLTAKVAFGCTQQHVGIDGFSRFELPGEPVVTQPAGILALRTNSGSFSRTAFSIVPELGVNLGYQFTDHCRVYVGYNLMFWTNVVRPGEQIDRVVNPNNWPSSTSAGGNGEPRRPAFAFQDSTFWAQGLVAGLEWRF